MNAQPYQLQSSAGKISQQFHTTHRHHLDTNLKSAVIK